MASKNFVRKQSPPSSSPSNVNHAADQSQAVNHSGSASASWASVAVNKNSSVAIGESALSNATPASSTTASASSSPRLKQKKEEKNVHRQSKSQNSKGHSAASNSNASSSSSSASSSSSSSPTPSQTPPALTPVTPNSSTPHSSLSSSSPHTSAADASWSSLSAATPSSSSPWWHSFSAGLPLGCQVRVQLKNGQECVGVVLSFEDTLKILVIELSSSSSSASTPSSSSSSSASSPVGNDYCMLHFEAIRSVLIVKSECVPIHLPPMKEEELKLKEQKAIESRKEAASRIGVNVSADAQRLFNAISKAYPCVWSNESIVVADVVSIAPPYTNEQVKPLNEGIQQDNLLRFQKILERERQRLKMK